MVLATTRVRGFGYNYCGYWIPVFEVEVFDDRMS